MMKAIAWVLVVGGWIFMYYKLGLKDKLTDDQRATIYQTNLMCIIGVFLTARWVRDQFDARRIGEQVAKRNYSRDRLFEKSRLAGSREWMIFCWVVLVYSGYLFLSKVATMPIPFEDRVEAVAYLVLMACGGVILSKCTRDGETSRQLRQEYGLNKAQ